jgi:cobalt-zinc-cadmium efflux system protein
MHSHHHSTGHHHHGHSHAPRTSYGRAFAIGIALNLAFVIIEAGYGFWADSMALLSDAGHNLSDVLGLAIAWGAALLARRGPTERFTYGLRSSSILAALFNALLLLVAVGGIAIPEVRKALEAMPGVDRVHHLHVWAVSTTETALTAHLVMPSGHPGDRFLAQAQQDLKAHFGIGHSTLQIEIHRPGSHDHGAECPLDHHDHAHEGHNSGGHHHH